MKANEKGKDPVECKETITTLLKPEDEASVVAAMLTDGASEDTQLVAHHPAWHSDKILRHALLSLDYKDPEGKSKLVDLQPATPQQPTRFPLPPVSQIPRPGAAKLDLPPGVEHLDAIQTVTLAVISGEKSPTKPEPKENSQLVEFLKVDELKLCLNDKQMVINEVKSDLLPAFDETKVVSEVEEVVVEHQPVSEGELSHAEILSQLSSARVLPAISSSQVCSVLSALDAAAAADAPPLPATAATLPVATTTTTTTRKRRHPQAVHLCEICPFITISKETLNKHLKEHSKTNEIDPTLLAKIKCPGCPNEFYSLESFQMHLAKDHLALPMEIDLLLEDATKELESLHSSRTAKIRVRNLNVENRVAIVATSAPAPPPLASSSATNSIECTEPILTQLKPLAPTPRHQKMPEPRITRSKTSRQQPASNDETLLPEAIPEEFGIKSIFRCKVNGCLVRLKSYNNLTYHLRTHIAGHPNLFQCLDCTFQTNKWAKLTNHLWRYHMIDIELFSCSQCEYKTNSFYKLVNIHQRTHSSDRPFVCEICDKAFKNRKQLRNHKGIHQTNNNNNNNNSNINNNTNGNGNLIINNNNEAGSTSTTTATTTSRPPTLVSLSTDGRCDVCSRTFSTLRMLRLHKDNVHGKLRPHLCNYCGYAASSKSTLKMHMRQHTGEKPFKCDECNYSTADHNSLRRHRMRHTGDKPYKCSYCSYACIQSSTYKVHLRSKHPGLWDGLMFSCPSCSFRTIKQANYLAHMAGHGGVEKSPSTSTTPPTLPDDPLNPDPLSTTTTTSVPAASPPPSPPSQILTPSTPPTQPIVALTPLPMPTVALAMTAAPSSSSPSNVMPIAQIITQREVPKIAKKHSQTQALQLTTKPIMKSPTDLLKSTNSTSLARQPVIINLQTTDQQVVETDIVSTNHHHHQQAVNIELLYCDAITSTTTTTNSDVTTQQRIITTQDQDKYIVEIEPHVVHLVEQLQTEDLPGQYNTVNVMSYPGFHSETITSDLHDSNATDSPEPLELKFKEATKDN